MRIMGLDYGTKTVGVAISDRTWRSPHRGSRRYSGKKRISCERPVRRIEELIKEYEVEKIVLGFPKHMNNDVGESVLRNLWNLRRCWRDGQGLEVVMWDERLTTVAGRAYVDREQCKKGKPQAVR